MWKHFNVNKLRNITYTRFQLSATLLAGFNVLLIDCFFFQEKDLEVCQASLAVAHAAAELAGSDTSDLLSAPASLTSQQLEEMEQLRRTVTSLHEELDVLRSLNTELQNEIEAVVRYLTAAFFSPESTILLVSTKDRDLWPATTPEVRNSRTHCQIWQIWLAENTKRVLCACPESRVRPEVSMPDADQKDRGLWGQMFTAVKRLSVRKVTDIRLCCCCCFAYSWSLH